MNQDDFIKAKVAVIKSVTPKDCFTKGIDQLGGISQFIEKDDIVFLKISLRLPFGFPTNSNFDLIEKIILTCKEGGAKKIYIGAFPSLGVPIINFDVNMGLEGFFRNKGAEFVYLDNSNYLKNKSNNPNKIKESEKQSYSDIKFENISVKVPNIILNSDKLIIINQVNVNPLFMCDLSLYNLYSIIPYNHRELNYNNDNIEEVVNNDKYMHDLISKIINVYSIKKPTLVINDIYYLLEKAGPFIYRDSKLRKTSLLVMGNNALAVDIIMLRILGLDIEKNDLISEIKKRGLGLKSFDDIKCLGENLEEISMKINQCHSKLEDIKVQNLSVLTGRLCSGCFLKAYHLFNFIKSVLVKDLKYLRKFSILIGLNPPEPQNKNNIIVFGKCAIKTTQNYAFRTLTKKKMFKKKDKNVQNKAILEIHGCPPDLRICLKKIFDFFGKSELPELNFLLKILESSNLCKYNEEIKI